jgi:hypothetical protein
MTMKTSKIIPLRVGQVRKLKPNEKGGSSRLVLVAEQDRRDGSFLVFLLNNFVDAAIPRDLCLSIEFTSANYRLVLMTEYFSRANSDDFELESLLGSVDPNMLQHFRSIAFNSPFGKLPDEILCEGVEIGTYPVQKYDAIWKFRTSEFDNFLKLTFVRDDVYLISSDYALKAYRQFKTLGDPALVDELPLDVLRGVSISRELVDA